MKKLVIHTDGAADPNPGPAGIGFVIKDDNGNIISSISKYIGQATNNQAEYWAVIYALEEAIKLGATSVDLNSDSELVVRQLTGMYRVKKEELKPLFKKVKQLQNSLNNFQVTHIKRSRNKAADKLTKKALESGASTAQEKRRRLIITLSQTSNTEKDNANLYKIINILRKYPGHNEVKLRVTDGNKIIHLRFFDIYTDFCPDLYSKLAEIVGEEGLRLDSIKSNQ